eukprot:12397993-Karenia_brevis.AAC.1
MHTAIWLKASSFQLTSFSAFFASTLVRHFTLHTCAYIPSPSLPEFCLTAQTDIMASEVPTRVETLAQSIDGANRDGAMTWEEAISLTEGLKFVWLEKPIVVHKEPGTTKIGDLPARIIGEPGGRKKLQFLDVIHDYQGIIDYREIEKLFMQQRYAELPDTIRMKGNCP